MNASTEAESPMLELFDKPECPFCWRVRLALQAQRRPYARLDRSDPDVLARWERLSPQRSVPILVDGDRVLTDSQIILEYLHDTGGALLPDAAGARAEVRGLVLYADTVLGKAIREVIFEKRDRPESQWDRGRIERGRAGFLAGLPMLERRLGSAEYFVGGYSMAECALTPRLALGGAYGVDVPDEFPRLRAWFTRMIERPGFSETAPPRVLAWIGH